MPSNDSEIDFQSTTWKAMENRISMRLAYFRRQNDGFLSEAATATIRGRIAELKDFLALAKDPDKVTDEQ